MFLFQLFREARRTSPCVLYSPHFDALWNATGDSLHATLLSLLQDLPPLASVLFLVTADDSWSNLPSIMKQLFSAETGQVHEAFMLLSWQFCDTLGTENRVVKRCWRLAILLATLRVFLAKNDR